MLKSRQVRDMFPDGIKIRKSVSKASKDRKEKRKNRREINDIVSEYYAKENGVNEFVF